MFRAFLEGITDAIFPLNCILCRNYAPETRHDPVCPECFRALPFNKPPFCVRCSRHLASASAEGLCPLCRQNLPAFDAAWVALHYDERTRDIIHRFKFHDKTSLRKTCRTIWHHFLTRHQIRLPEDAAIIPIPLHPVRLRERGYNQAELLAEVLSGLTGLPLEKNILIKQRYIPPQSLLGQKERWTNISGAFRINPSSVLKDRSFVLVDDLLTTGATAHEAARTLKEAGAAHIELIVLAAT